MNFDVFLLKKGDACCINESKGHVQNVNRLKGILWFEDEYSKDVRPIHFSDVKLCKIIKFVSELM